MERQKPWEKLSGGPAKTRRRSPKVISTHSTTGGPIQCGYSPLLAECRWYHRRRVPRHRLLILLMGAVVVLGLRAPHGRHRDACFEHRRTDDAGSGTSWRGFAGNSWNRGKWLPCTLPDKAGPIPHGNQTTGSAELPCPVPVKKIGWPILNLGVCHEAVVIIRK